MNRTEFAKVWSSSIKENVEELKSVSDPCSIPHCKNQEWNPTTNQNEVYRKHQRKNSIIDNKITIFKIKSISDGSSFQLLQYHSHHRRRRLDSYSAPPTGNATTVNDTTNERKGDQGRRNSPEFRRPETADEIKRRREGDQRRH